MSDFNPGQSAPSAVPANVESTVRAVLIGASGYLVGKGWLSESAGAAVVTVALAVLPLLWAYARNHLTRARIQAAIDAPAGLAK